MRAHHSFLSTAAALSAAAALTVGVPTAASAQTWNHTDPAGDVTTIVYDESTDEETQTLDPSIANGDVVSTTVKHNPRKVIASVRLRDLALAGDNANVFQLSLRTNKLNRDLMVFSDADLASGVSFVSRPNGDSVRCRGASHRVDYTAHTVTLSVPRSCLGRPKWVKASVLAATIPDLGLIDEPARAARKARKDLAARVDAAADPTVYEVHVDDALSPTVGEDLVYGPRLRRG